jgi:hypothetical protein
MQRLRVLASTRHPGGDRGMPVVEDTLGGGRIQSFGECRQHHGDLTGGSFQTVQRGMTPGSERHVAGLTAKRLDPLSVAMLAISNQGVDVSVYDPGVQALPVRTGEALGVYPLRCSPPAFDLTPGAYSRRRRLHNRREGGGETTGWAIVWGARLEKTSDRGAPGRCSQLGWAMMAPGKTTKPCQREHEAKQEEEQEEVKGHQDPRRLKLG